MRIARVLRFAARLPRRLFKFAEWLTGRRVYPWTASPPHALFATLAARSYGRPAPRYRVIYAIAAGILKYRERLFADHMNFDARLGAPVDGTTLRGLEMWQQRVLAAPPGAPKAHANLRITGDPDDVQIDRAMSLLLMSDVFANINLFFEDALPQQALIVSHTAAEERRGSRETEQDLNAAYAANAGMVASSAWLRILSRSTGFDRNVNSYLKTAHPGAVVIALGLPENADGFCDDWLEDWTQPAAQLAARFPDTVFVILNRAGPAALRALGASRRGAIAFARMGGLTLPEVTILAQKADAFIGHMDVFGIAARVAHRPGVYMSDTDGALSEPRHGIVHTPVLHAREAMNRLEGILSGHLRLPPMEFPHAGDAGGATVPATANPRAAGDQLAAEYTLVVPTYNRPAMLTRLLAYLKRTAPAFRIFVLDSSSTDMQAENARAIAQSESPAQHFVYPSTIDPYVKMRDGLAKVETPYCSLCADDDVIFVDAVHAALQALAGDPAAAVAHGWYFNFEERSSFELSHVVYRGASLDQSTALARLRALFASYEAVFYGVYCTRVAQAVFRDIERMDSVLGRELLTAALTAIHGKILRIPQFYYGRSTAPSFSYSMWHPHQILAHAPQALFSQYPVFRELLLQALAAQLDATDSAAAATVLDLIMLRYLQPFLRGDVLDVIIDERLSGKQGAAVVERVWDVFVRSTRSTHPVEPLVDASGRFRPDWLAAGSTCDYTAESDTVDGAKRAYTVFYEFLFPDLRPPAIVAREQLVRLLSTLDAY